MGALTEADGCLMTTLAHTTIQLECAWRGQYQAIVRAKGIDMRMVRAVMMVVVEG